MRIAIFGTGGAGGYFGAQLAHAGEDVVFIARGPHLQAIRTTGLRLDTPAGEIVIQPARVTDDPAQVGEVDVVLLGVKAWQVTEATKALGPMIGPETMVVPLQNGVEAPSQLAAQLGYHVVLWNVDTNDWRKPGPDAIVNAVMTHLRPGAIVLMHDGGGQREQTMAALERVLSELSAQGWRFTAIC